MPRPREEEKHFGDGGLLPGVDHNTSVNTTVEAEAVQGDDVTKAGTNGMADQGGGKAGVIRKDIDMSGGWDDVEDCSMASMEAVPTSCDRPHELLEALGASLETVQCQIEINEHAAVSKRSKKLSAMDEGFLLESRC